MFTQLKIFFILIFILLLSGCSERYIQSKVPTNKKQYQKCKKHTRVMNHALVYITKEFEEGYFKSKDIIGAKAQLFLIESDSPTVFAQNINSALKSYNLQYNLAKKNGCDVKNFKTTPLIKLKERIKQIQNIKVVQTK